MSFMKAFNDTINYLESVLDNQIDEKNVLYISGYSYPMFSRLFSILTNLSLSEYLRERRLSEAAVLLRETDKKVIDIASLFGYESPNSFGAAFKSFHGATPSEVRAGKSFKVIPRIQLVLSVQGGRDMNITMQKKEAFIVAGLNEHNIDSTLCPQVWNKLYKKYSHDELTKLGDGKSVGVCHDISDPNTLNYMAGYLVKDSIAAQAMGLDILEVQAAEYAVVELTGKVPECIHEGWKYVMEVFFPEQGYVHSGAPDFEYYFEGDMQSNDYKMELWVPVVKKD
ncbi:AraC family transcriptional regulator [Atopobium fossor]|uniref:AraC family transcriptional regulator n=1 Tax=Atopobium fossor TaxID=39487 RepID=UPI0003F87A28|nr:AraC family transcriptional regulator [Atopobium fossor]